MMSPRVDEATVPSRPAREVERGDAPASTPPEAAPEARTSVRGANRVDATRGGRRLLARRGRAWDAQDVAEHLMSCRGQMVHGLRSKTPWAGLDLDTLDSCFGHGAAVIAKVAASGQRPEWRTSGDLEKAQVAAFRHQALDHWKRINAQSRRGDRVAVSFDPERHAPQDAPMDRLFDQPDLVAIQRDLLAELADPELRAFWEAVLGGAGGFKSAGDELGLGKAQVMARTRAGRAAFSGYLDRRESGELCEDRGGDIAALRAGTASELRTERAEAHLEACYACALIHQPRNGALERGMLGAAPIGLLLRLASRASDLASIPATRWVEAGAVGRLAAAGVAALTVAASGAGIQAATDDRRPTPRTAPGAAPPQRPPALEAFVTPALVLRSPAPAPMPSKRRSAAPPKRKVTRSRPASRSPTPPSRASARSAPSTSAPATSEFSFERGSQPATPTPTPPPRATTAPQPSPPVPEVSRP